jgi:hypothetical protein
VVNNESAEIVRMFGTVFRSLSTIVDSPPVLYPDHLAPSIDEMNDWIYSDIANGSYKAGFSLNQDIYEQAYQQYFVALEHLQRGPTNSGICAKKQSSSDQRTDGCGQIESSRVQRKKAIFLPQRGLSIFPDTYNNNNNTTSNTTNNTAVEMIKHIL